MKISVMLLVLMVAITGCRNNSPKNEKEDINRDTTAEGRQLTELDALIAGDPGNAGLYHRRAKIYLQQKRLEEANKDMLKAVSIDSLQAGYYLTLADIYFAGNRIMNARYALEKTIAIEPQNFTAHSKLAEVLFILKKYNESLHHVSEMLKLKPDNALAYFIRGMNLKEAGDTARAIAAFQMAVENDRSYYNAHMQLGVLYSYKNNPVCVEYFSNALRINPNSEEALYGRAMYFQENNELDKAIQDYTQILKINPKNKNAHFNLGYVHYTYLKVYSQAIKHYDDALQAEPHYPEAYYNRGLCYEAVGNLNAAIADYQKALQLRPGYQLPQLGLKRIQAIPGP